MPTVDWLKKEFSYGFSSGNVLSPIPTLRRVYQEMKAGGSYRQVFQKAIIPHLKPNSLVLELGAGAGSWSRAILTYIPEGKLYAVDFQDVSKWLKPERYNGRLVCYRVNDNSFSCIEPDSIDFFWSFGVLCHNNLDDIRDILRNSIQKMKHGGIACHQYADWEKLDKYGWRRGGVPVKFRQKPDDEIWWPRNSQAAMKLAAKETGWFVVTSDMGLLKRDGLILLKRE